MAIRVWVAHSFSMLRATNLDGYNQYFAHTVPEIRSARDYRSAVRRPSLSPVAVARLRRPSLSPVSVAHHCRPSSSSEAVDGSEQSE